MELFLNEWSALPLSDENTLPESLNFFRLLGTSDFVEGKRGEKDLCSPGHPPAIPFILFAFRQW